jgi:hypothetical protein
MNKNKILLVASFAMTFVCFGGCIMGRLTTESELPSQLLTRRDWSSDFFETDSPLSGYIKFSLTFQTDWRYVLRAVSRDENSGRHELFDTFPGTYCVDEVTGKVTLIDDRQHQPPIVLKIEKSGQQVYLQLKHENKILTFRQKSWFIW